MTDLPEKPWVKTYCGGKPNYCTPEQEPLGGEWVPCVKLPIIVHVRNQRDGETHISTREGITPALPEDLIMRGVAGEEYPIGRELFERTYTFDVDAVNMTQERVDETAKCKREWVGLTDEEMRALKQKSVDDGMTRIVTDFEYIRSIEAKLKEKNYESS